MSAAGSAKLSEAREAETLRLVQSSLHKFRRASKRKVRTCLCREECTNSLEFAWLAVFMVSADTDRALNLLTAKKIFSNEWSISKLLGIVGGAQLDRKIESAWKPDATLQEGEGDLLKRAFLTHRLSPICAGHSKEENERLTL